MMEDSQTDARISHIFLYFCPFYAPMDYKRSSALHSSARSTNNISYEELDLVYMEHQNWLHKGCAFLKRKFFPNNHE